MPKVEISVTTTKFDKKLAYWPLAAPLFILFLHFLFAKPMKISLTIGKKKVSKISQKEKMLIRGKEGITKSLKHFFYLRNL